MWKSGMPNGGQKSIAPFSSLRFLLTGSVSGLSAAWNPPPRPPVRKQIQAAVQVYWEGQFYPGTAIEISSSALQVKLAQPLPNLDQLVKTRSPVGLLLGQSSNTAATRLIAHIEAIDSGALDPDNLAIELVFPKHLEGQQGDKIRHLLRELN